MRFFDIAVCAVTALYLTTSCSNSPEKDGLGHHHSHSHEHQEGHKHQHDTDHEHSDDEHLPANDAHGDDEISLPAETAAKMGVTVQKASKGSFHEVIKVSGQIIPSPDDNQTISATSAGIVTFHGGISEGAEVKVGQSIASISSKGIAGGDPNAASRAAVDAARRELERLTPLHDEGIVSTKDYNAARAAYEQARAAYSGTPSGGTAASKHGGVITRLLVQPGAYVTAGQPIAEVSGNKKLTLRADVPARYQSALASLKTANFRTAYSDSVISLSQLGGRMMTNGLTGGSRGGYASVYFTLNNNGTIAPGTFAEIYLIGNEREGVISVPVTAVTEQQGNHFIYVRLDEDCYDKRPVALGGNDGRNVEILSGINEGDNVVVAGAIAVKLAESSGVVPEGHSHNH